MQKKTTVTTTSYPDGTLVMEVSTASLPVIKPSGGNAAAVHTNNTVRP